MGATASVFDMSQFTVTTKKVPAPGADCRVPDINKGTGQGSRITSTNFLTGEGIAAGQDQVVVKGDQSLQVCSGKRWVEVKGNQDVHIQNHLTTKIDQGEERTVKAGRVTTVEPSEQVNIKGPRTTLITGNETKTIFGAYVRTVLGGDLSNEVSKWHKCWGLFTFEHGLARATLAYLTRFRGGLSEVKTVGLKVESGLLQKGSFIFNKDEKMLDLQNKVLHLHLGVMDLVTAVAKLEAGGWRNDNPWMP